MPTISDDYHVPELSGRKVRCVREGERNCKGERETGKKAKKRIES